MLTQVRAIVTDIVKVNVTATCETSKHVYAGTLSLLVGIPLT